MCKGIVGEECFVLSVGHMRMQIAERKVANVK